MDYSSATETAKRWGISSKRVQVLCRQGRIDGVTRVGNMYLIPANAEKPKDERVKSGRYIKEVRQNEAD